MALTIAACNTEQESERVHAGSTQSSAARSADPPLPGVGSADADLDQRLQEALESKGSGYVPRTEHKRPDGSPRFINRLIFETSPYLLQHAHNPVNWYAWGDEAFTRASLENKPVLLSIGYSTCHWCHVMERESFENEEIARYLNEHFVAIKVDREERPDVDDVYMTAVQMLTGRGGWPMTVVLTPDRKPFFGGTYFPPDNFHSLLQQLKSVYDSDPGRVTAQAQQLSQRIRQATLPSRPGNVPGPELIASAANNLADQFDTRWGGFGRAPKFPRPATPELLLRYHRRTGDPQALQMVEHTLERMASGGIHDQIGGGFHRYSVDNRWLVPHFEKMLYDNAQLTAIYLDAYQVTGRQDFARVAEKILDYVAREMTAPGGAFYSATDADSPTPSGHDEEGYFFTWTPLELKSLLTAERLEAITLWFNVTPSGNFEGRNIFHTTNALEIVADSLGQSPEAVQQLIDEASEVLYNERAKRPPPLRDDKILTSWSGIMISAFARGGLVLGRDDYTERGRAASRFLLEKLRTADGRLMRSYKEGAARHVAYLDDYAFLIQGLIDLYEASFELHWLEEAIELQAVLDEHYLDDAGGGYYMTADDAEELITRSKPSYDGAEPSGNSVAILNLLRLFEYTMDESYRRRAEQALAAFSPQLSRNPLAFPKMLSALDHYLDTPLEVLLVTTGASASAESLLTRVRQTYLPNRVLVVVQEGRELRRAARKIPLLEGKVAINGVTTAFVCERGLCELPTSEPAEFARQISKVEPLLSSQVPSTE